MGEAGRGGGSKKNRLGHALAPAMLVCALSSAASHEAHSNRAPGHVLAMDTVRIAATAYAGTCPVLIARTNGYFASEGIEAQIEIAPSGRVGLQSALSGRVDLATVADVPIMFAVTSAQPVSVIATISSAQADHAIIGRRDRGVLAPSELRGKRIGVPLGTSAHFFLDAFLNRQALAPADVTLHDLRPEELVPALARGDVDAIAIWQPFVSSAALRLGSNGVRFNGESVYDVVYALAGSRAYVSSHARNVERVLRATIRGARFCQGEPLSAQSRLAKIGSVEERGLQPVWSSYRFEVVLRQGLLLALEDETRWAIRNKLTAAKELPNYLNTIDLEPLESVSPGAVTLIH